MAVRGTRECDWGQDMNEDHTQRTTLHAGSAGNASFLVKGTDHDTSFLQYDRSRDKGPQSDGENLMAQNFPADQARQERNPHPLPSGQPREKNREKEKHRKEACMVTSDVFREKLS